MTQRPTYTIIARLDRDMPAADAARILRIAFKRLLRGFDIRVVEAKQTTEGEQS